MRRKAPGFSSNAPNGCKGRRIDGRRLSVLTVSFGLLAGHALAAPPSSIDFGRDILPILSNHCFLCHGPDPKTRKGDLRLDVKDAALRTEDPVIVPGKGEDSELIRRIVSEDDTEVMPPRKMNRKLTPGQVELLRRWIDQGAAWGRHWAYEPPRRPDTPGLRRVSWPRNPLDRFILSRLEHEGLEPSPEAPRETLIRRLFLDLTGVPPTPEDVETYLADDSPAAYEDFVDRLLASPRYGERMAWDWLDAARYADSNGYQGDNDRTMWPWRDWVVRALNANMPFDRFTIEQLAGDLLPDATPEQKLATAFNRNHMINGEGGRIAEENRVDYIMDQVETVSTVWLGLTMTCARCHDHKYDPITQRDYYQLFAFFNQTPVDGSGGSGQARPVIEVPRPGAKAVNGKVENPRVMVMEDMARPRETFLLIRGSYERRGERVQAGLPANLAMPGSGPHASRLGLARWLTSRENSLTARVTVNRAWQTFFGVGLVKSAEDFGVQGEKPSHPELLDWLAAGFLDSGWDVKTLHRLIVTSATYRQSSRVSPELLARDPENRLLARGARFRLPSWMIRDQALAVAGLLDPRIGGPPVNSYQPPGVWEEATFGNRKYQQDKGDALYRRSLYVFWRRIVGPTAFFDTAARQVCVVKPARTNSPLHALTTLNDVTYVEAARALARRVLLTGDGAPRQSVTSAFREVLGRRPTPGEEAVLVESLARVRAQFHSDPEAARRLLSVGESPRDPGLDPEEHAALTAVCLAIFNLDESLSKE
jgi:hypothetical protein